MKNNRLPHEGLASERRSPPTGYDALAVRNHSGGILRAEVETVDNTLTCRIADGWPLQTWGACRPSPRGRLSFVTDPCRLHRLGRILETLSQLIPVTPITVGDGTRPKVAASTLGRDVVVGLQGSFLPKGIEEVDALVQLWIKKSDAEVFVTTVDRHGLQGFGRALQTLGRRLERPVYSTEGGTLCTPEDGIFLRVAA